MDFGRFDTFVFDLDGTIWRWQRLYPGARETIKSLKAAGKQVLFVTNNTLLSKGGFVRKLNSFGIKARPGDIIDAGYAAAVYLKRMNGKSKVMAFGRGLVEEMKRNGIKLSAKLPVDFLIVGHDLGFNMKKLTLAYRAVEGGARLIGTARGRRLVTEKGILPGTGLMVELVEKMSGREAEIIGKPSDIMCELTKRAVGSGIEKTVLFGDELNADIVMGKKIGCATCLVETGVHEEPTEDIMPDFVIGSVADIKA